MQSTMPHNLVAMQKNSVSIQRWIDHLFWSKLSRPLALLGLLLLGSATATGYSLSGHIMAGWTALALALGAFVILVLLLIRVRRRLKFVKHLRIWAQQMRGGNLSSKIPMSNEPDLASIIEDINSLGGMLETLAFEMDAHSHAQTVRLARKTQSLDILYEIALSLTQQGSRDQVLESFLDTFIELVDARAATAHLLTSDGQMRLIASRRFDAITNGTGETLSTHCPHCGWTISNGSVHILTHRLVCARLPAEQPTDGGGEVAVVPFQYHGRTLGIYTLYLDWPMSSLGEDALELLISIGRHLGLAIEKTHLDSDARRLAIMEERNIIGNELHDSLAQSLVSMRLRVKMLGEMLHRKDLRASQNEVRMLRESLDEAHSNLRDLLSNFRLKIDERGLVPAVENIVERFREETGIAIFFHNECQDLTLTPAQELQVFHIIQEALSNIRKHSYAHTARIRIGSAGNGRYEVLIEDDGFGIDPPDDARPGEHIGLQVMQERARRLPGEITIESEPGEGTRVSLTFGTNTANAPASRAAG